MAAASEAAAARLLLSLALLVLAAVPAQVRALPPALGNATALFVDGNRDQDGRSWACVRGAALVRAPDGSLLAFAGGGTSCADGHIGFGILLRSSADNGSSWQAWLSCSSGNTPVVSDRTSRRCPLG